MNQAGFTLLELLIVIAIIGTLIAVLLPQFTAAQVRAWDTQAQSCASALSKAGHIYRIDHPRTSNYPAASYYHGTSVKEEEYGTASCRGMTVAGKASEGDFEYSIKHPNGHHTYIATLSGIAIQ